MRICGLVTQVRVVLGRTVGGSINWRFDNRNSSSESTNALIVKMSVITTQHLSDPDYQPSYFTPDRVLIHLLSSLYLIGLISTFLYWLTFDISKKNENSMCRLNRSRWFRISILKFKMLPVVKYGHFFIINPEISVGKHFVDFDLVF